MRIIILLGTMRFSDMESLIHKFMPWHQAHFDELGARTFLFLLFVAFRCYVLLSPSVNFYRILYKVIEKSRVMCYNVLCIIIYADEGLLLCTIFMLGG